ncbi:MAG: hypothetical protein COA71_08000 [SAR86 cluster bacterium]|uniref:DUF2214 domain-containing protein n=1 Tax=SAR86 cluster bacterium TaxID=2030880 RepID=A0A2A5CDA5_9GAMM|nr:hypothetical protein [Gammaproteobacteria bacterium AH-315-E17]PCJ41491.1 MAG: hypothetical protein COA71_08000 [SAR86 cluster bacterium]
MFDEMMKSLSGLLAENPLTDLLSLSYYSFPVVEVVHVVTYGTFFGGMMMLDFRLLGVGRFISTQQTMRHILNIAWFAFALANFSGIVFFFVTPWEYPVNSIFQYKMLLIILAGLNALWMHKFLLADIDQWDMDVLPPRKVRVSAFISICLWVGVVVCGRLIAYSSSYGLNYPALNF